MPSSFIDRDNGYKKRIKDLDGLGQLAGTVGIHAEEGSQDEADAANAARKRAAGPQRDEHGRFLPRK